MVRTAVVVFLVALAGVAMAGELDWSECGASDVGTGKVLNIRCDQFPDLPPGKAIELKKGQTYTFEIVFSAAHASPKLGPEIVGIIAGIPVKWEGVNKNSCEDLQGNKCPITSGTTYTYKAAVPILANYPSVSLTFQWGMNSQDAAGKKTGQHICFRMPAQIVG